jgi:hypothetical protein
MKTKLILFISIIVVTASCRKHDDNNNNNNYPPPTNYVYDTIINPYLLQNFLFNKGSYWIYRDSVSGQLDSCAVDTTITGMQYYQQSFTHPAYTTEYRYKYTYNVRTGNFPAAYLILDNHIQKYLQYPETEYHDYNIGIFISSNNTFALNDNDTYFPAYMIDTISYSSVYKLFYENPWHIFSQEDSGYYYMKAGLGIIKSEYYINGQRSVYELVRYHIN